MTSWVDLRAEILEKVRTHGGEIKVGGGMVGDDAGWAVEVKIPIDGVTVAFASAGSTMADAIRGVLTAMEDWV